MHCTGISGAKSRLLCSLSSWSARWTIWSRAVLHLRSTMAHGSDWDHSISPLFRLIARSNKDSCGFARMFIIFWHFEYWGSRRKSTENVYYNREHIELPAKLLDYMLRSNKSNINQSICVNLGRKVGFAFSSVS